MTHLVHSATVPRPHPAARPATTGALNIVSLPTETTQATVWLRGELDLATAGLVSDALDEQLAQGRRFVRLDLSRLTFLDCTGLRAIVEAHNRFLYANGTLVLTRVTHRAARLLSLTHLDEALLIADGPGEPRRVRHLAGVSHAVG